MTRRVVCGVLSSFAALTVAAPGAAFADANSIITVGVGTGLSFTRSKDLGLDAANSFGPEINVKLKALYVLGLEMAVTPGHSTPEDAELIYDSTFRVSGLLYIVPLDVFGFYLKVGVGADRIGDIIALTSKTNSYHAGAGFDVYLYDHFAIGAEFLMLAPGVNSVGKALITRALESEGAGMLSSENQTKVSTGSSGGLDNLGVSDFLSPENFRLGLSLRYFF